MSGIKHPIDRTNWVRDSIDTGEESRVRQAHRDEVEIHNILERYANTGLAPISKKEPIFADVSAVCDFKEALDKVSEVGTQLHKLPKEARELLYSDRVKFAEAIAADTTREKLEEIGFLEKKPEPPPVVEDPVDPPVEGGAQ